VECPNELLDFRTTDCAIPFLGLEVDDIKPKPVLADDSVNSFVP
jgi:hypothetical protein